MLRFRQQEKDQKKKQGSFLRCAPKPKRLRVSPATKIQDSQQRQTTQQDHERTESIAPAWEDEVEAAVDGRCFTCHELEPGNGGRGVGR